MSNGSGPRSLYMFSLYNKTSVDEVLQSSSQVAGRLVVALTYGLHLLRPTHRCPPYIALSHQSYARRCLGRLHRESHCASVCSLIKVRSPRRAPFGLRHQAACRYQPSVPPAVELAPAHAARSPTQQHPPPMQPPPTRMRSNPATRPPGSASAAADKPGRKTAGWDPQRESFQSSAEPKTAIHVPGAAINNPQPADPYSRRVPPTSRKDVWLSG